MNQDISSNNVSDLTQILSSASAMQLQSLSTNSFTANTMTNAINNIATQGTPQQLSNLVQNISPTNFNTMVGGAKLFNKSSSNSDENNPWSTIFDK